VTAAFPEMAEFAVAAEMLGAAKSTADHSSLGFDIR
jgi:hypothetical protein